MNALCNFSHRKSREVAASLSGRFLRCSTLCITMEVKRELRSSKNAIIVAFAKKLQRKGDGEWGREKKRGGGGGFTSFFG